MPGPMQVISREEDPTPNIVNAQTKLMEVVNDIKYKRGILKHYADTLAMDAKRMANERDSAILRDKADNAKLLVTVLDDGYKIAKEQGPEAAQEYLVGVMKANPQLTTGVMEGGFDKFYAKVKKDPQQEAYDAMSKDPRFRAASGYNGKVRYEAVDPIQQMKEDIISGKIDASKLSNAQMRILNANPTQAQYLYSDDDGDVNEEGGAPAAYTMGKSRIKVMGQ